MSTSIQSRAAQAGLRMTAPRRVIAKVLDAATDHPDAEALHARAVEMDPRISLATVYRTVKLFEENGILEKHTFGDGRARYEAADVAHHDHLIDMATGQVIEFVDPEIEALQDKIAKRLGYRLVGHRLSLFGERIIPQNTAKVQKGGDPD
ncbi:Fur family transcriptional regulator [Loktanella sp. R86503]|uniref:Fur family transcriptional regulator n=1 Tax=Loktanella sp. R86503 TaxID=3093847 RepID=UPI0036D86AE7